MNKMMDDSGFSEEESQALLGGRTTPQHKLDPSDVTSCLVDPHLSLSMRTETKNDGKRRPKPKSASFIRPVINQPSLKKTHPMATYAEYTHYWDKYKPPGESDRRSLCWEIKEQLTYQSSPTETKSNANLSPKPKSASFIRPVMSQQTLKKSHPGVKFAEYTHYWDKYKPPGESDRRSFCWDIKEKLQYQNSSTEIKSDGNLRPKPKSASFIRPVMNQKTVKKINTLAKYAEYTHYWDKYKPPGESDRRSLCWDIKEQLTYQSSPIGTKSDGNLSPKPKSASFIRPVMSQQTLKKTHAGVKHSEYTESWKKFKPPGESDRRSLCWEIRDAFVNFRIPCKN